MNDDVAKGQIQNSLLWALTGHYAAKGHFSVFLLQKHFDKIVGVDGCRVMEHAVINFESTLNSITKTTCGQLRRY